MTVNVGAVGARNRAVTSRSPNRDPCIFVVYRPFIGNGGSRWGLYFHSLSLLQNTALHRRRFALRRELLFVRAKSNQKRAKTKVLESFLVGEHLVLGLFDTK